MVRLDLLNRNATARRGPLPAAAVAAAVLLGAGCGPRRHDPPVPQAAAGTALAAGMPGGAGAVGLAPGGPARRGEALLFRAAPTDLRWS